MGKFPKIRKLSQNFRDRQDAKMLTALAYPRGGQLGNCPPFHNLLPTSFFEIMAIAHSGKILILMHVNK